MNNTYRQNGTTLETGKKIVVTRFGDGSRIFLMRGNKMKSSCKRPIYSLLAILKFYNDIIDRKKLFEMRIKIPSLLWFFCGVMFNHELTSHPYWSYFNTFPIRQQSVNKLKKMSHITNRSWASQQAVLIGVPLIAAQFSSQSHWRNITLAHCRDLHSTFGHCSSL